MQIQLKMFFLITSHYKQVCANKLSCREFSISLINIKILRRAERHKNSYNNRIQNICKILIKENY